MPRLSSPLLVLALFFSPMVWAQQTTTSAGSDPQAVAAVQASITAMGGATAISALQSWTFQAQAQGRIANGTVSEGLSLTVPQNTQPGTTANAPPPWATPRSVFVPALVAAILQSESQDANFVLKQAAASSSVPNSTVVAFLVKTKSGGILPAQIWYFDMTSSLPNRVDFIVPARIGAVEAFAGPVILTNYQTVGGVLYPFEIVTFLHREHASQTITLQSVTPSTTAANTPSGGAQ